MRMVESLVAKIGDRLFRELKKRTGIILLLRRLSEEKVKKRTGIILLTKHRQSDTF